MPINIEIHVLLGANLEHTAAVLEKMKKQQQLKNIVVQVGINNKAWTHRNTVTHINRIINTAKKLDTNLTMCGIPALREMKDGEKHTINQINTFLKDKLENYVEPLKEVCMKSGGLYDNGTFKAFSQSILNSNFLEKPTKQQSKK